MKDFKKSFLGSAKWIFVVQVTQTILQFALGIVLARLILPETFGKFSYMLALVEGITIIIGFAPNTSILQNQEYPERDFQNTGFFFALMLILVYGLIASVVGLVVISENIAFYLCILCGKVVFMLSGVHGIVLQKNYQFKIYNIILFVSFLVSSATGIFLAISGFDLTALVAQYVVLQVLIGTSTIIFSDFKISRQHLFNKQYLKTFLRNGRELFASTMVEKWLSSVDKIVINNAVGAANLAFYNKAIGLNQRFISTLVGIFQPLFSVSFANLQGDREQASSLFNTSVWLLLRVSVFITLVIMCTAKELVEILYGSNWLFAARLVPLIAIFVILQPSRRLSRNFLLSNGYFTKVRNIQLFELTLFFGFVAAGAYCGGIEGVSIAVSGWALVAISVYMVNISKVINLEARRLFLSPAILFVVVLSIDYGLRCCSTFYTTNSYLTVLISSFLVVFIYMGSLLVFESGDVKALIQKMRS